MDLSSYKGPYIAVPLPIVEDLMRLFLGGETYNLLKKCVIYEPDNHHNAAMCPYCSIHHQIPQDRYDRAWLEYIEKNDVIRADGNVICPTCSRSYRNHLQPLKDLNPTIRILCDGTAVKL